MELISPEIVALDVDLGSTCADVIGALAHLVARAGRADADGLTADVLAREDKAPTGFPGGFAIPHCHSASATECSLAFARLSRPVDFGAKDGPADLVFLIATADGGDVDHLKVLARLARALVKREFPAALRRAASPEDVVTLVAAAFEQPGRHP